MPESCPSPPICHPLTLLIKFKDCASDFHCIYLLSLSAAIVENLCPIFNHIIPNIKESMLNLLPLQFNLHTTAGLPS